MMSKKRSVDPVAKAIEDRFNRPMSNFRRVMFEYDKPARVRLLGKFMELGRHVFQVGDKWYYITCWKRVWIKDDEGKLVQKRLVAKGGCSICKFMKELGNKKGKASKKVLDYLSDKRKNEQLFVWNCLDRLNPKDDKGELAASELAHKWQVFERIHEIQKDENRNKSVSNPAFGCDLKITKKKRNKQTKYLTSKIKRTPLTEEEKNVKLIDLSKRHPFNEEFAEKAVRLLSKKTKSKYIEEEDEEPDDLEGEEETTDEDIEDDLEE